MIGDRIKMLRIEKGNTMKEMAEMLDLSISAWHKYEKNEAEPKIINMLKIADFFGVSLDFLLGRTNIRSPELLEKTHTANELMDKFEEITIGDPSCMYFIIENLVVSLQIYQDGKINEDSLQLLLETLGTLIVYFNDLSNMKTNTYSLPEVLNYHNKTSSEMITNLNNMLYSIYETQSRKK